MKLRRQQQIERELNGYRAWIDKAGKTWGLVEVGDGLHRHPGPTPVPIPSTSAQRANLDQSGENLEMTRWLLGFPAGPIFSLWSLSLFFYQTPFRRQTFQQGEWSKRSHNPVRERSLG